MSYLGSGGVGANGVATSRDGLRLQGFGRPARRHFTRNDGVEVALRPDDVDDAELPPWL